MSPHYSLLILWSETEQRYFANIPELQMYSVGAGVTLTEAAQQGEDFLASFLAEYEAACAHRNLPPLRSADRYENHGPTPRQLTEQKQAARQRLLAMPPEAAQVLVNQTLYPQLWEYDPNAPESRKALEWDWQTHPQSEWEPEADLEN